MPDVQYPYAYDKDERLVSIRDVSKGNRAKEYHCPNCHELMHPRLGDIRAHCFAHASGKKCSEESYLHKVAKDIFTKRLTEGNLILRVKGVASCPHECKFKRCESSIPLEHNISEIYDSEPKVEKSIKTEIGRFIPDIVLNSSQED